jgi:hypothetical protein
MHFCLLASIWFHFRSASKFSPRNFTTFSDVIFAHFFSIRDLLFLKIHTLHFAGANCNPLSLSNRLNYVAELTRLDMSSFGLASLVEILKVSSGLSRRFLTSLWCCSPVDKNCTDHREKDVVNLCVGCGGVYIVSDSEVCNLCFWVCRLRVLRE